MGSLAFIFPGQGSQAVGMGQGFWRTTPAAQSVFAEADAALDFPLSRLCFEGPEEELRRTENAQPAILTVSIAALESFLAEHPCRPAFVAGHSLGEYGALVAAGVLSFGDAVRLVRKRGSLMTAAQPAGAGAMAAVIGLEAAALQEILAAAQVETANLNCPGQVVISGETSAVALAGRLAKEKGAAKVIPLDVSGAFHSSMMRPAADRFAPILAEADLRSARIPVVANVTARPATEPEEIGRLLVEQICASVRWEESVRYMAEHGINTYVEFGAGKVLTGLVRRIDRTARIINIMDESSLKEALAILGEV